MITVPINSLDDWVRETQRDLALSLCMSQPLNERLDEFVKTDNLGKLLREKAIARLSGTLSENDSTLWTWSRTIDEEFIMLKSWIRNFTLGWGISRGVDLDEAIDEVKEKIISLGVDKRFANGALDLSISFWKKNKEYYQKEREKERAKADAEKRESAVKLFKMGLSVEQVAEALSLSIEEINEIKKKIQ